LSDSFPGSFDIHDLGPVPVADDGYWSTTFHVPDNPDNRYAIAAWCMNVEDGRTRLLKPFDVREPAGDPIETPPGFWDDAPVPPATVGAAPAASPAQPVRAAPAYTGYPRVACPSRKHAVPLIPLCW
jgi:hypothetical protein